MPACITACWADTSTCWPRPLACRSVSAEHGADGRLGAGVQPGLGTAVRTGARSLSPLSAWAQPAARTVRSDAAHPALGPSAPNAVTETWTTAGLAAATVTRSNWPLSMQHVGGAHQLQHVVVRRADDALLAPVVGPPLQTVTAVGGGRCRRAARPARPRHPDRPGSSRPTARGGPWHRPPGTQTTSQTNPRARPGPLARPSARMVDRDADDLTARGAGGDVRGRPPDGWCDMRTSAARGSRGSRDVNTGVYIGGVLERDGSSRADDETSNGTGCGQHQSGRLRRADEVAGNQR